MFRTFCEQRYIKRMKKYHTYWLVKFLKNQALDRNVQPNFLRHFSVWWTYVPRMKNWSKAWRTYILQIKRHWDLHLLFIKIICRSFGERIWSSGLFSLTIFSLNMTIYWFDASIFLIRAHIIILVNVSDSRKHAPPQNWKRLTLLVMQTTEI